MFSLSLFLTRWGKHLLIDKSGTQEVNVRSIAVSIFVFWPKPLVGFQENSMHVYLAKIKAVPI